MIYFLLALVTAAVLFGIVYLGLILRVAFGVNGTSLGNLAVYVAVVVACVVLTAWLGPLVWVGLFV